MRNNGFTATDPAGLWDYTQLIGATVKIKSLPVGSGLFGYDSEKEYTIESIGFRLGRYGKAITSIKLIGIKRDFTWKDLEVVGLQFWLWNPAVTGEFCCGRSICGYKTDVVSSGTVEEEECNEGIVLD